MKKTVFIARNFREAERQDIRQQISMTPSQRQRAALALRRRIYGSRTIDIRRFSAKA